jgi:MFS family permease
MLRTSYVMAVVTPPERATAASVTAVPRTLASAVSPTIAGVFIDHGARGLAVVVCGALEIIYDLGLLYSFRHIKTARKLTRSPSPK